MSTTDKSLFSSLAREPTVHFLLLAGLLFIGFRFTNPESVPEILIDWQEIEARIFLSELNSGQEMSATQRQQIEDQVIDDHVLVYEAFARGLQNDPRINEILAQKMRHVLSGEIIQPTEDELRDYYLRNQARYQIPPRLTVDELVFATREPLPIELVSQLHAGTPAAELNTPLLFTQGRLPQVDRQDLAAIFSSDYADLVFAAEDNLWIGPFISNRGQHWLHIQERLPATQLALEEIVEQARLDWITEVEEQRLADAVSQLRRQYRVTIANRPSS